MPSETDSLPLISAQSSATFFLRNESIENSLEGAPFEVIETIVDHLNFLDALSLAATSYQLQRKVFQCRATFQLSWPSKDTDDCQYSKLPKPLIVDIVKSLNAITDSEANVIYRNLVHAGYDFNYPPMETMSTTVWLRSQITNFYLYGEKHYITKRDTLSSSLAWSDPDALPCLVQHEFIAGSGFGVAGCFTEIMNFFFTWGEANPTCDPCVSDRSFCGWDWDRFCESHYHSPSCTDSFSCGCANHCDGLFHGVACLGQHGCFNCAGLFGMALCGLSTVTCLIAYGLDRINRDQNETRGEVRRLNEVIEQLRSGQTNLTLRSALKTTILSESVSLLLFNKAKEIVLKKKQDNDALLPFEATSATSTPPRNAN